MQQLVFASLCLIQIVIQLSSSGCSTGLPLPSVKKGVLYLIGTPELTMIHQKMSYKTLISTLTVTEVRRQSVCKLSVYCCRYISPSTTQTHIVQLFPSLVCHQVPVYTPAIFLGGIGDSQGCLETYKARSCELQFQLTMVFGSNFSWSRKQRTPNNAPQIQNLRIH